MTPDVNVLVAASRGDHPHHQIAFDWLNEAVAGARLGAILRLPPIVLARFVRLVTHSRIFVQPTPTKEAFHFLDALLAFPGVDVPPLGPEWAIFRKICLDHRLAANSVPDAWLAATVIHLGDHLVSFDVGFKRLLPRSQLTVLKG